MEIFYLFIVIVLIALAISDLVVGVSNDAVNFVNSAIGSKAGTFRTIMIIAALGVLIGATFSSGMMEVARKGIFNPEHFYFREVMIIFLVVMATDVLLLDLFNTAGLPTSTTVSLVFGLLGGAFAVSTIKIIQAGGTMALYAEYINTGKVIAILSGILLSVAIGFTVAMIVQFFVRLLFTFDYLPKLKYFGSVWGGIATAAIVYFIFIKGAKGASFLTEEVVTTFKQYTWQILLITFLGAMAIFQLLFWIFRINILRIIVFTGTFALAMAFASNDLVNFIGVPLAGLESFQAFKASGSADPGGFTMELLLNPMRAPTLYLLIAGIIMGVTLFVNKKARTVTRTEVSLGRQEEGNELFRSSSLARGIVLIGININKALTFILPGVALRWIDTRFTKVKEAGYTKDKPAFDLVRASVILIVASIIITMGTNLKLPLSTTYITFMVAMGASLADRAWGRESAVYRVNGVITVIGGWFFTGLMAFTVAGVLATIIYYGGLVAVVALVILALFIVYRTHVIHRKKEKEVEKLAAATTSDEPVDASSIHAICEHRIDIFVRQMGGFYERAVAGLVNEKRNQLKKLGKEMKEMQKEEKTQRKMFDRSIRKMDDASVHAGVFLLRVMGQMKEARGYMSQIQALSIDYVDNQHPPFLTDEKTVYIGLASMVKGYFEEVSLSVKAKSGMDLTLLDEQETALHLKMDELKVDLIRHLKHGEISSRKSMAIIDLMTMTTNLIEHTSSILRIQKKFNKKFFREE